MKIGLLAGVTSGLAAASALASPPVIEGMGTPIRTSKASIRLVCGDKSYKLTSGKGGKCEIYHTDDGGVFAGCADGKKGNAFANCSKGCTSSSGAGDCD